MSTNLLLSIGLLLFLLDFCLAAILGYRIGYSAEIIGWSRMGVRHPIWLELILIAVLFSVYLASLIAINTKPKIRAKILEFFLIDKEKFLLFISPYILAFVDAVILYKILSMYILGRY